MSLLRAARAAEVWIAALVIAVVAMLIVPLPRPLLARIDAWIPG